MAEEDLFKAITEDKVVDLEALIESPAHKSHWQDYVNSEGSPLLHWSVVNRNLDALKCLLNHGADFGSMLDMEKRSVVHVAVEAENTPALELLLKNYRANPNPLDARGHTPLWYAERKNLPQIGRLIFEAGGLHYVQEVNIVKPVDHFDPSQVTVLVVIGHNPLLKSLSEAIAEQGFSVTCLETLDEASRDKVPDQIDVAIADGELEDPSHPIARALVGLKPAHYIALYTGDISPYVLHRFMQTFKVNNVYPVDDLKLLLSRILPTLENAWLVREARASQDNGRLAGEAKERVQAAEKSLADAREALEEAKSDIAKARKSATGLVMRILMLEGQVKSKKKKELIMDQEIEEMKKKVQTAMETPVQALGRIINDLGSGKTVPKELRVQLAGLLDSINKSAAHEPRLEKLEIEEQGKDWLINEFSKPRSRRNSIAVAGGGGGVPMSARGGGKRRLSSLSVARAHAASNPTPGAGTNDAAGTAVLNALSGLDGDVAVGGALPSDILGASRHTPRAGTPDKSGAAAAAGTGQASSSEPGANNGGLSSKEASPALNDATPGPKMGRAVVPPLNLGGGVAPQAVASPSAASTKSAGVELSSSELATRPYVIDEGEIKVSAAGRAPHPYAPGAEGDDPSGIANGSLSWKSRRTTSELEYVVANMDVEALVADASRVEFNALRYAEEGQNPDEMLDIVVAIFKHMGYIEMFQVPLDTLYDFLEEVRRNYRANPYHNFFHGFDVFQTTFVMIGAMGGDKLLGPVEAFATLVAALCHDLDHPGLNNAFQMNSLSSLAVTYNDSSVLENYHTACTFRILSDPRFNLFRGMTADEFKDARRTIIHCILGTDMANHFEIVSKLSSQLDTRGPINADDENDRQMFSVVAVHSADISNQSKPQDVALAWSHRVKEEFHQQGDVERERGWPISPYCDRSVNDQASMSVNFIDFVVGPLYNLLYRMLPNSKSFLDYMQQNRAYWSERDPKSAPVSKEPQATPEPPKVVETPAPSSSNRKKERAEPAAVERRASAQSLSPRATKAANSQLFEFPGGRAKKTKLKRQGSGKRKSTLTKQPSGHNLSSSSMTTRAGNVSSPSSSVYSLRSSGSKTKAGSSSLLASSTKSWGSKPSLKVASSPSSGGGSMRLGRSTVTRRS